MIGGITGGIAGGVDAYKKDLNVWSGKEITSIGRSQFSFMTTDKAPNMYATSKGPYGTNYTDSKTGTKLYNRGNGHGIEYNIKNPVVAETGGKVPGMTGEFNTDTRVINVSTLKGGQFVKYDGFVNYGTEVKYYSETGEVFKTLGEGAQSGTFRIPYSVKTITIEVFGMPEFSGGVSPLNSIIYGFR